MFLLMMPLIFMAQEVDLKKGLVAFYPFDSDAMDKSGNNNNGQVNGAILNRESYMGEGCYQFKGVYSPGTIRVKNNNTLHFSTAASFSFWFRQDMRMGMDGYKKKSNTGKQDFFGKNFDRGQINAGVEPVSNSSTSYRIICGIEGGGDYSVTTKTDISRSWNHIVFIFHKEYIKIYLNGKLIGSKNCKCNFSKTNNSDLIIGGIDNGWYPFYGKIDEFRVYNRELNTEEILALARGEGDDNVVLHYRDYKFSDEEPDYKLFEDKLTTNTMGGVSYTYCKSTKSLYLIDESGSKIIEYNLTNIQNKDVKKRTISLPFKAQSTFQISPNGLHLAFIDEEGNALHIIDVISGKESASAKLGKKFANLKDDKTRARVIPMCFQSDNEILLSGSAKAFWFDIAQNKGKTISFSKQYATGQALYVASGTISKFYYDGERKQVTFEISNGKINKTLPNVIISDKDPINECYKTRRDGHYYFFYNSAGEQIPFKYYNSDMSKYIFITTRSKVPALTTLENSKYYLVF